MKELFWDNLTDAVLITGPRHSWIPLLSAPGLLPSARPPLCPALLLSVRAVIAIRYWLKGALLIFLFLGGEHSAAGEPVTLHRRQAGVAAKPPPPLIAGVAVAWCAVTGGAVARGAVAGGVTKLALAFTWSSVGAAASPPSSSIAGIPLLAFWTGRRDPPDCCVASSKSFTFQKLIQLREALNGEAAGQRAPTAGARTPQNLHEFKDTDLLLLFSRGESEWMSGLALQYVKVQNENRIYAATAF